MRLRVIDFGSVPALRSQAVYHGLAEAFRPGDGPVLSLVNPSDPYVCIGLHQEVALDVDEDYCRGAGLPVIRRHVGGGAVYLDAGQMFFHFIYPPAQVPARAVEIYPRFIEPVVRTYRALGVEAAFRPVNDIHVHGRKIGGTGAARIGAAAVMVGSFMFDFDIETMARCVRVPSEKFRDKLRLTLREYMTTLRRELDQPPSRAHLKTLFLEQVEACLGVTVVEDRPTAAEEAAIRAAETELADPEWTHRLGRRRAAMGVKIAAGTHLTEGLHKAPGGLVRVILRERDGRIDDLLIEGDFTALPDDGVAALAQRLRGVELTGAALLPAITGAVAEIGLDLPGVAPGDLVAALLGALHRP